MRTRLWGAAAGMLLLASVGDLAAAHHSDGHVKKTHGLCTAYFNGSETGRESKREAKPFEDLAEEAGEAGVWGWCNGAGNAKGVGGRPTDPDGDRTTPKDRRGS